MAIPIDAWCCKTSPAIERANRSHQRTVGLRTNGAAGKVHAVSLRTHNIARLGTEEFDVVIIGGGINGAVSGAALSAHGAKVALIDARDFAGSTSQHSSNLVWGGIKYMEGFEFGLVAGLCASRNQLMRAFPSTIREIRFLTTVDRGFRHHPWTLWLGAWVYWLFGRCFTRTPKLHCARSIEDAEPLVDTSRSLGGIEYSDAYLHDNDARFVFNFVRDAMDHGCAAANYVRCDALAHDAHGRWRVQARDELTGAALTIGARVVINATGPCVDDMNGLADISTNYQHVLSKGVHLLVPRLGDGTRVLAFFADDGRLFFAIPMASCTCIGTTDTRVDSAEPGVTDVDRDFILNNINARLNLDAPLTKADIIAERCGVRPLAVAGGDDGDNDFLQLSRKHVIETDSTRRHVSIFGGKLTDCLNVGAEVCEQVRALGVELTEPEEVWYGEPSEAQWLAFEQRAQAMHLADVRAHDTGESLTTRLWRRYRRRAHVVLDEIARDPGSLEAVYPGTGLRWCEVAYVKQHEMVNRVQDLLRRRSKLLLLKPCDLFVGSEATRTLCEVLFGERAEARYQAFLNEMRPQDDEL
jgi:glycerol-3-phosphate dehydrogenase